MSEENELIILCLSSSLIIMIKINILYIFTYWKNDLLKNSRNMVML